MNRQRPQWRKSSHSGNSGNCIEVAAQPMLTVAVRDSRHPHGPELAFTAQAWMAFTTRAKHGRADLA